MIVALHLTVSSVMLLSGFTSPGTKMNTAGDLRYAGGEIAAQIGDSVADLSLIHIFSSHISSDLEGLCDDIYMIHEGRIIFHEDTDVLLNQYGLLKVDEKQFEELDKRYLLKKRKEHYGYACLTKEKQYYIENYPDIVVEKGTVDELIAMMIGGNEL